VTPREHPDWTVVRVAKWAMLATAIGFGGYAIVHSTRADDRYTSLRRLCETRPEMCAIDANGRYTDPTTEDLFARTREEDRRAQVGIIGGQVALFGSVALFVYDLRHARGPGNIPYPSGAPEGAAREASAWRSVAAGLRLAF
jgi:hypothetical protein